MKLARALSSILFIICIGIAIGAGLFYLQKQLAPSASDTGAQASASSSPTAATPISYTNQATGLTLTLPSSDWYVVEGDTTVTGNVDATTTLTLMQKQSGQALKPAGLVLYLVDQTSTTATKTIQRLTAQIMSTWKAVTGSPKSYQDADGNAVALTSKTSGDLTVLAVTTSSTDTVDANLTSIINSFKVVASSPTASNQSSPLLQTSSSPDQP